MLSLAGTIIGNLFLSFPHSSKYPEHTDATATISFISNVGLNAKAPEWRRAKLMASAILNSSPERRSRFPIKIVG